MFTPKTYGDPGMEIGGLNDTLDPANKLQGLFSKLAGAVKTNPFGTLTTAAGVPLNLMGLFDNNKLGYQLGGAAVGGGIGALAHLAGAPWASGINLAALPLAGGALGAGVDALRASNEQRKTSLESTYPGIREAAERYMQNVKGMSPDQLYQYDMAHPGENAAFYRYYT